MGGATIWPVPRALDAEAHYYPRMWKRNMFFLYGAVFLMGFQFQRYAWMCRVRNSIHFANRPIRSIAIDDKIWRIHGLGKQTRSQESQIHQGLKSVIHATIYLTLTNLTEIIVNLAFSVPFLKEL